MSGFASPVDSAGDDPSEEVARDRNGAAPERGEPTDERTEISDERTDISDERTETGSPPGTDRRSLLYRFGVIPAVAIGALVAGPSPPDDPVTAGPPERIVTEEVPYAGELVTDESETPIARYQYRPAGDGYVPTAPINVVYPVADTEWGLTDVVGVLVDAGWTTRIEEYARYALDREAEQYVFQHATAGESSLGMHGRLHVRCWSFEGVVSMQAHIDTAARPRHGIASYADAREAIVHRFTRDGWAVAPTGVDLENARGDHDGIAAVLVPEADQ